MKKRYEDIRITLITLTETDDILLSEDHEDTEISGGILYDAEQAKIYRPGDSRYENR